jgi:RNA polymerase-binding transcription factor DksA
MLNEGKRATLEAALQKRRLELLAQIKEQSTLEAAQGGQAGRPEVGDFGDEDTAAELVHTERALLDLHREDLRDVEAALERLADGMYGICVDCGGLIGEGRLAARPASLRCEPCQELQEADGRRAAAVPR